MYVIISEIKENLGDNNEVFNHLNCLLYPTLQKNLNSQNIFHFKRTVDGESGLAAGLC